MKKRHIFLFLFVLLLVGIAVLWVMASHPRPEGKAGPAADALARAVGKAAGLKGWAKTKAISWNFGDRYRHLWDRRRQLSRVRWGKGKKQTEALFVIAKPTAGIASRGGKRLTGKKRAKALKQAYKRWCNDSFWLNPLAKLFDKGVTRKLVKQSGGEHLLIEFSEGGVTPGDTYFFVLGPNKLPTRWHMFVSIIPVKGLQASFDGWKTLDTGAKLSTIHKLGPLKLVIKDIKAAASLKALFPTDPFAALVGTKAAAPRPAPNPSSRPAARPADKRTTKDAKDAKGAKGAKDAKDTKGTKAPKATNNAKAPARAPARR